jgi:hypothetical protein
MPRFCAANFPPPFSHFPGLPNIMNINEVQRSNGVTRRTFVVEWCGFEAELQKVNIKILHYTCRYTRGRGL